MASLFDAGWNSYRQALLGKGESMTTENVRTKISKEFTFSAYTKGTHVTKGWLDNAGEYAEASFVESLSPLHKMIEAFSFRPLGIKIRVIMEEVD